MIDANPNTEASLVHIKYQYENVSGGAWVPPKKRKYLDVISPVTGQVFTSVTRSTAEDVELALDAAHAVKESWGNTSVAERAQILNKIADRIEENIEMLAVAE